MILDASLCFLKFVRNYDFWTYSGHDLPDSHGGECLASFSISKKGVPEACNYFGMLALPGERFGSPGGPRVNLWYHGNLTKIIFKLKSLDLQILNIYSFI